MATVLKDNYSGYRWLDTERGDVFTGQEPVDSFGAEGALNEFYFDLSGFFEIKFDKAVVSHIAPFLLYKFDAEVKRQDVVLFWQITPSYGKKVDNILDDAERFWSLAKDSYERSIGRGITRRE